MSPLKTFLVNVIYSEEKKEIACQFRNGKKGMVFRKSFFPQTFISIKLKQKALNLISLKFKKQISLISEKNSLKVIAINFSVLKNFCFELEKEKVSLIEPERQFLILNDWSYFDEFVFENDFPVKISSFKFPLIEFDLIPLNSLLKEMFDLSPVNARELLNNISLSKLLKIPPSNIPKEKFLLCELFLQNCFFKNFFSFPERNETNFLPVKREKINSVKENLCEMNFNEVWSKLFNSFNLGFNSLNCNCCKPNSLNESNLLPNSLIEVEFFYDGLFFSSFNPSFASLFHNLNPLKQARKKHQLEWGLEFPALGPFMREEKALIPFPDAMNLLKEKKIKINFNSSKLKWFCKKNNSFLVNSFNELNEIIMFSEKKLNELKKNFLNSFGLNYELKLNSFPEFNFFNFLQFNADFLLDSIPFHLLSPFSRFYSSTLAESIDSIQNMVLNEFKQNLSENGAKPVFVSPEKVLIKSSSPLSILNDFSLKSGFPSPKIVSEWNSCLI